MKKTNQNGFAHVMLFLLLLVVVAGVAFAGYKVVNKNNSTKADATTASQTVSGTVTLAPLPDNLANLITPEKLSQLIENTATASAKLKSLNLHEVNGKPVFDATLTDGTRVAYDAQTGAKVTPSKDSNSGSDNVSISIGQLKQAMSLSSAKQLAAQQKAAILAAVKDKKVAATTDKAQAPGNSGDASGSSSSSNGQGDAVSSAATDSDTTGQAKADTILKIVLQNMQGKPAYDVVFKDGTTVTVPAVPSSDNSSNGSTPTAPPCKEGPIVHSNGKAYAPVLPTAATDHRSVMMCPLDTASTN